MKVHHGAVVLQHKDFPCATSKRGHESNNLCGKVHSVGPLAVTRQKYNPGETKPVSDSNLMSSSTSTAP